MALNQNRSQKKHIVPTVRKLFSGGFTLPEVIIVSVIILFILSVTLPNRASYEGGTELKNIAYELALTVRSAQTMGSNGRILPGGTKPVPHGVHVTPGSQALEVFADTNASLSYDSGESIIETYTVPAQRVTISRFCVTDQLNTVTCSNDIGAPYVSLDISFTRPNVTPYFRVFKTGNVLVGSNYRKAVIYIQSDSGPEQGIVIVSQGLIYIQD
jgi:prepilin-type N-terminal cleavage/methylation domain-containing protein